MVSYRNIKILKCIYLVVLILLSCLFLNIKYSYANSELVLEPESSTNYYSSDAEGTDILKLKGYIFNFNNGENLYLQYKFDGIHEDYQTLNVYDSDGKFTEISLDIYLDELVTNGEHTLRMRVWHENGEVSNEFQYLFLFDSKSPILTITSDLSKGYTEGMYEIKYNLESEEGGSPIKQICIVDEQELSTCGNPPDKTLRFNKNGIYTLIGYDMANNTVIETVNIDKIIRELRLNIENNSRFKVGTDIQLYGYVNGELNSDLIISSKTPEVVDVNSEGLLRIVGEGEGILELKIGNVIKETKIIGTNAEPAAILLEGPEEVSLGKPETEYRALLLYSDGYIKDVTSEVTFYITDENIAQITYDDNKIMSVEGLSEGNTTLGAIYENGEIFIKSEIEKAIKVRIPYIVGYEFSTKVLSLSVGSKYPIYLYEVYSNGTKVEITDVVRWTFSDLNIVETYYDNTLGDYVIFGKEQGYVVVNFEYQDNLSNPMIIYVGNPLFRDLSIDPNPVIIPHYSSINIKTYGIEKNNKLLDKTANTTFRVVRKGDNCILEDGENYNSKYLRDVVYPIGLGKLYGEQLGEYTLCYKIENLERSATVKVIPVLEDIWIAPSSLNIFIGTEGFLNAKGRYSDGSVKDITSKVSWEIINLDVAEGSLQGSSYNVIGKKQGRTQIRIELDGYESFGEIVVSNKLLVPESAPEMCTVNWYEFKEGGN